MVKKRVFISFDYDNDLDLYNMFVGQARHPETPWEIVDYSFKEAAPQSIWEQRALEKIRKTDAVAVIIGSQTHRATGVLKEISMANRMGHPIFGIKGRSNLACPLPNGLSMTYRWTWDNVARLLEGQR